MDARAAATDSKGGCAVDTAEQRWISRDEELLARGDTHWLLEGSPKLGCCGLLGGVLGLVFFVPLQHI